MRLENLYMTNHFHYKSNVKGPHVLITAGVHGDEYEPIIAARNLIEQLPLLLQAGSITIIPIVNMSAVKCNSRYGSDGLDLARICPGNATGTASEFAAAAVSKEIKQADYYIDMHTGGKVLNIFPLAGYLMHPNASVLDAQRKMAKAFGLPIIWGTEAAPNGRTLSVARDANIPAIYVEYGGGSTIKEQIVEAYMQGCKQVLIELNMLAGTSGATQNECLYCIEDTTPNNGHLQSKLPAPIDGFFKASKSLGAPVQKGQLWGHIYALDHPTMEPVLADEDGLVLFLREDAFVKKGDSLGGILPTGKAIKI
jgi:predicted deacylase